MPCFGADCRGFARTGAHDSVPTQAAEINSVMPKEVVPKEALPTVPNEASPVPHKALPTRIGQTDGPATTPERSASPETSHEKTQLTSATKKGSPARSRPPRSSVLRKRGSTRNRPRKSPANRPIPSGSQIRKVHEAHRGGIRRSPRIRNAVVKEIRIPISPVAVKGRSLLPPSPLKESDKSSSSEEPEAPIVHDTLSHSGRQRVSKVNEQPTPPTFAGTGSSSSVQEPAVSPSQTNCACPSSALRVLEELETRNHLMQDYTGFAISQHLTQSLGKCVAMLECKRCIEISEQMMLMIIIAQKILKMFSRLATRFIEQDQSILAIESVIPLPRLVLLQQLRLDKVLERLTSISTKHSWKTHMAMLDPICQYSADTMNRLRRMNGLQNTNSVVSN